MTQAKQSIPALYDFIKERQANPVAGSYTDYLFTKGLDKILKKSAKKAPRSLSLPKILMIRRLSWKWPTSLITSWFLWLNAVSRLIKLPPNWLVAKERRADCKNGQKSRNINALKRASLIDKA